MVLRETYSRHTQTGLGFISLTPVRRKVNFRFTIFEGAITTLDVIFYLTMVHHYYGKPVIVIEDRLSSHLSAREYFEREHPHGFFFEELPSYLPELNPVEQCWHQMKRVLMENFVPKTVSELVAKTIEQAQFINNDPKLIEAFFKHAKLKL